MHAAVKMRYPNTLGNTDGLRNVFLLSAVKGGKSNNHACARTALGALIMVNWKINSFSVRSRALCAPGVLLPQLRRVLLIPPRMAFRCGSCVDAIDQEHLS